MGGRVMDGRALWRSQKVASLPEDVRPEYPWLHPLAGSNGVFENDPRAIWAECYAYSRPSVKLEDVERFINEFIRAKLLFPYEANGKRWCYWTGSDKLGRLPRPSHRQRDNERGRNGPDPPNERLVDFMEDTAPARQERVTGTAIACREHASDVLGLGLGSGLGSGLGKEGAPKTGASAAQAKRRPSPLAFSGTHLRITERQDRILGEAFPWVDRPAEYRKADSWIEAHPERRPKKFAAFAHNWFVKIPAPSSAEKGASHAEHRGSHGAVGAISAPAGKYDNLPVERFDTPERPN